LPTKDHFSSSWTFAVRGGKSHQLVVELVGVAAGPQPVADHRVLIDADQAAARGTNHSCKEGQQFRSSQPTAFIIPTHRRGEFVTASV